MKMIISCLVMATTIASPFQGHCGYYRDCSIDGDFIATGLSRPLCYLDQMDYSKCLLQIDLIKETTDKAKQDRLKTILEVDLLCLMDRAKFNIEMEEENLVHQTRMRDEGNHPSVNWDREMIEARERLNDLQEACAEIEQLIKQHTR